MTKRGTLSRISHKVGQILGSRPAKQPRRLFEIEHDEVEPGIVAGNRFSLWELECKVPGAKSCMPDWDLDVSISAQIHSAWHDRHLAGVSPSLEHGSQKVRGCAGAIGFAAPILNVRCVSHAKSVWLWCGLTNRA